MNYVMCFYFYIFDICKIGGISKDYSNKQQKIYRKLINVDTFPNNGKYVFDLLLHFTVPLN